MDIDKLTDIEQLRDSEQRELAETIGLEAYKRLVKNYGGMPIYVQQANSVMKGVRDQELNEKFDGDNFKELAVEYGLSKNTVRAIVTPKRKELRSAPLEGQLKFETEK